MRLTDEAKTRTSIFRTRLGPGYVSLLEEVRSRQTLEQLRLAHIPFLRIGCDNLPIPLLQLQKTEIFAGVT